MALALVVVWPAVAGEDREAACLVGGDQFETCLAESRQELATFRSVHAVALSEDQVADHSVVSAAAREEVYLVDRSAADPSPAAQVAGREEA